MPVAAVIPAVIGAGAAIYGANKSAGAAKDAANQQAAGQQAAIDEQRRQYDQTRGDLAPYRDFGPQNLAALTKLMNGDYSGFDHSPDYLFSKQQMIGGSDASAAARGGLYNTGHLADLASQINGLASQNLGNYRNSLEWGANLGENASAQTGQFGANAANQIGDAYGNIGNAQAQGTIGSANAWANGANQIGNLFGNLSQSSFGGGSSSGTPSGGLWGQNSTPIWNQFGWG